MWRNRSLLALTLTLALAWRSPGWAKAESPGVAEYRAALAAIASGTTAEAVERFSRVQGILEPWARVRVARSSAQAGDTAKAEALLQGRPIPAALRGAELETLAICRATERRPADAARLLESELTEARLAPGSVALRQRLAGYWFDAGEAGRGYAALLNALDQPGESSAAKREVVQRLLGDQAGDRVFRALAPADRFRWARFLAGHSKVSDALQVLAEVAPGPERDACKLSLTQARWLSQLGKRDNAAMLLGGLAENVHGSKECRAEALLTLIRVQAAGNDAGGARVTLGRLLELEPESGRAAAARLELADLEAAAGGKAAAEQLRAHVVERQPGTASGAGEIWSRALAAYGERKYGEAERLFALYLKHHGSGRSGAAARYWRALAASRSSRNDKSLQALASDESAGLYRVLASSRLKGGRPRFPRAKTSWSPERIPELLDLLPLPAGELTETAQALREAGAWEELALLLEYARRQLPKSFAVRYGLSRAYERMGQHQAALQVAEVVGDNAEGFEGIDRHRLDALLYPVVFVEEFAEQCRVRTVSPYLALAITREESRFQPDNRSWADARGLMQVVPSTGEWIAKKAPMAGYAPGRLYEPGFNIAEGVWYLAYLLDKFSSYPSPEILAMAAYNGGPGNVGKWLKQFGDLPLDEFVERIPLEETRNYVKKVTASLLAYERLYGGTASNRGR
ncbi:MAG: lytic transglycosylase domain-containing protein [Candidatus Wallbacteria bacterium]|nr:lytic transglycosylase domain-containing protein [Candidatus Wallbacteria bacterium]